MDFNITSDSRYFQLGDTIYDSVTGLHTVIDNPNPIFICEMYKNIFIHSRENNILERNDLFKKMKSLIYPFFLNDSNVIMEYEVRYGMMSIIESQNYFQNDKLIIENSWEFVKSKLYQLNPNLVNEQVFDWIKDKTKKAWDATKKVTGKVVDTTKKVAGKVIDSVKQAGTWILNKGLPWFFQKLEDFLISPVGIGLDIALTSIGIGKIATTILWGALGIWKIYEILSGKKKLTGNWKDDIWTYGGIAMCFVGLLFSGGAKAVSVGLKAAGRDVLKLGGKVFAPIFKVLGKGGNFITNSLLGPMEWLAKTLGGNKIAQMISTVKGGFNKIFTGMTEAFKNVGKLESTQMAKNFVKKDLINPTKAALKNPKSIKKAAIKGTTWGLAFKGGEDLIHQGGKLYGDYKMKQTTDVVIPKAVETMDDEINNILKKYENKV